MSADNGNQKNDDAYTSSTNTDMHLDLYLLTVISMKTPVFTSNNSDTHDNKSFISSMTISYHVHRNHRDLFFR